MTFTAVYVDLYDVPEITNVTPPRNLSPQRELQDYRVIHPKRYHCVYTRAP